MFTTKEGRYRDRAHNNFGRDMMLWMGQWTPFIFSYSSNWKELQTLLLTLQNIARDAPAEVYGTTLFYFTDNMVTYYINASGSSRSPGLHALVEQIRYHELLLGCQLQVVHIPGVVMIEQGTDGLSRGIWASSLHQQVDQATLTKSIFRPADEKRPEELKLYKKSS